MLTNYFTHKKTPKQESFDYNQIQKEQKITAYRFPIVLQCALVNR